MCRNIKTLFNFDPPATDGEIYDASLQSVRKLSGFHKPSQANVEAYNLAVEQTAVVARKLLNSLTKELLSDSEQGNTQCNFRKHTALGFALAA